MTPRLSDHPNLPAWANASALKTSFRVDEATPSNNTIKGMHFHAYKKTRMDWAKRVQAAISGQGGTTPLTRAGIVVVRGSVGHLDWDNALGGLKPLLDCLVCPSERNPNGLGVITDDNPTNMPEPPYMRQVKAKRGAGFTEVFVFEV